MEKEENNTTRSRWLHLRLRPEEHEKLMRLYRKTTCRKVSEFVRNCLFDKPLTVLQRNASLDRALLELGSLREELRAIGQNLNQVTHRINADHTLAGDRTWQASFTVQRQGLELKMDDLQTSITKLSAQWLR